MMRFFHKKFLLALSAAFLFFAASSCSDSPQSAQKKIDRIANDMKPQLPKMLDKDTRLVNVYTKQLELISEYELVNYRPGEADYQKTKNKIELYLNRQVCPNIKKELLGKGISAHYIYKGNNGQTIVDRVLSPGDC